MALFQVAFLRENPGNVLGGMPRMGGGMPLMARMPGLNEILRDLEVFVAVDPEVTVAVLAPNVLLELKIKNKIFNQFRK